MKRLTAALTLFAACTVGAAGTGRYQLVPGEYLINDYVNGGQIYARTTFKIDTTTGEVWAAEASYMPSGGSSTLRIFWLPTDDFKPLSTPQDLFNEFQRWAQQQPAITPSVTP